MKGCLKTEFNNISLMAEDKNYHLSLTQWCPLGLLRFLGALCHYSTVLSIMRSVLLIILLQIFLISFAWWSSTGLSQTTCSNLLFIPCSLRTHQITFVRTVTKTPIDVFRAAALPWRQNACARCPGAGTSLLTSQRLLFTSWFLTVIVFKKVRYCIKDDIRLQLLKLIMCLNSYFTS